MSEIKISYEMGDIDGMDTGQKIDLLLKIAFSNHSVLVEHGKLLFGNGHQGVCDSVRSHGTAIRAVWGILMLIIAGLIGLALK